MAQSKRSCLDEDLSRLSGGPVGMSQRPKVCANLQRPLHHHKGSGGNSMYHDLVGGEVTSNTGPYMDICNHNIYIYIIYSCICMRIRYTNYVVREESLWPT